MTPSARTRLRFVLFTLLISLVTVTLLRDKPWSDGRTATALNVVHTVLFLGYIAWSKDRAMTRLLVFGLCLGIGELVADALCVHFTHTLDYSVAHSPMLGLSPWWMPTAWMVVAAQIGYVGIRLMERFGDRIGMALTALLGAVNIPFYEEMAYHAHWWRYQNCKMIGHTPVYIIVAELLIGLTLGPLARIAMRDPDWHHAAAVGLVGGLGTIIGGLVGYGLVERVF
jgi:hypothetical protein